MRRIRLPLLIAIAFLIPATAHAGWFVGPNFGIAHVEPEQGEAVNTFGWGGSTALFGVWQPGLRVGGQLASGSDEIFTDSGFEYIGSNGTSFTALQISANYQHDFFKPKAEGVFINGGVGILNIGGDGSSTTVPVFGAGLGYANPIADGHGRFRFELRLDHQNEDQDHTLSAATLISLRLGFDLID